MRRHLESQISIFLFGAFISSASATTILPNNELKNLPLVAQSNNQGNFQNQVNGQNQIIEFNVKEKSFGEKIIENTYLNYYQQFLGPTAAGGDGTYNVFQEGIDSPGTGRAPMQSFHAVNLRHQLNQKWAFGATLSGVNGYTREVQNVGKDGTTFSNKPDGEIFNARAYVSLPPLKTSIFNLFTNISYEHPTSNISKNDDMKWGWVISQSMAFNLPDYRWSLGVMGQVYRIYYSNNVKPAPFSTELGGKPTPLQTLIVSAGPYVNYRFSDHWMIGSNVIFDWDQRGEQTSTSNFNNNLSDRGRLSLTYFPMKIKYLQSIGLFSQALLKFRPETTAFGADFGLRF